MKYTKYISYYYSYSTYIGRPLNIDANTFMFCHILYMVVDSIDLNLY